jgi:hypothetical protein
MTAVDARQSRASFAWWGLLVWCVVLDAVDYAHPGWPGFFATWLSILIPFGIAAVIRHHKIAWVLFWVTVALFAVAAATQMIRGPGGRGSPAGWLSFVALACIWHVLVRMSSRRPAEPVVAVPAQEVHHYHHVIHQGQAEALPQWTAEQLPAPERPALPAAGRKAIEPPRGKIAARVMQMTGGIKVISR